MYINSNFFAPILLNRLQTLRKWGKLTKNFTRCSFDKTLNLNACFLLRKSKMEFHFIKMHCKLSHRLRLPSGKKGGSAIRLSLITIKSQNPPKIVHGFSWFFRVFFRSKRPKLRQLTKNDFLEFWKMRCKKIAIASWLALKIK